MCPLQITLSKDLGTQQQMQATSCVAMYLPCSGITDGSASAEVYDARTIGSSTSKHALPFNVQGPLHRATGQQDQL
jgi:hypothetical protein